MLTFKIDDSAVRNRVNKIEAELPSNLSTETRKFSDDVASAIRKSASMRGLKWSGRLINSIVSRKIGKDTYGVFMVKYGEYLDADVIPHAKQHYISLKRGRKITRWAADKFGATPPVMVVHAHPFIRTPLRIQNSLLHHRMKRATRRAVGK